jgi:hypothetical protein
MASISGPHLLEIADLAAVPTRRSKRRLGPFEAIGYATVRRRAASVDLDQCLISAVCFDCPFSFQLSGRFVMEWKPIATAPFDRDLELSVIDYEGTHSLVFPCRRVLGGWIHVERKEQIDVEPTHWREWAEI